MGLGVHVGVGVGVGVRAGARVGARVIEHLAESDARLSELLLRLQREGQPEMSFGEAWLELDARLGVLTRLGLGLGLGPG